MTNEIVQQRIIGLLRESREFADVGAVNPSIVSCGLNLPFSVVIAQKQDRHVGPGEYKNYLVLIVDDAFTNKRGSTQVDTFSEYARNVNHGEMYLTPILYKGKCFLKPSKGGIARIGSDTERQRHVATKSLERKLAELTDNNIAYFDPEQSGIMVVSFGGVKSDYDRLPREHGARHYKRGTFNLRNVRRYDPKVLYSVSMSLIPSTSSGDIVLGMPVDRSPVYKQVPKQRDFADLFE